MSAAEYNLRNLAAALSAEFHRDISGALINKWQRLPKEPFPVRNKSGYYKLEPCVEWCKKHFAQSESLEDAEALRRGQIDKAKLVSAQLEAKQLEIQQEKHLLVERAVAAVTGIAAIRRYHGYVRDELEKHQIADVMAKLKEIGCTPEQLALALPWLTARAVATVTAIEARCAAFAREIETSRELKKP